MVPENMHTPPPWYVFLELHIIGFKLVSFIIRVIMAVFSQYNNNCWQNFVPFAL